MKWKVEGAWKDSGDDAEMILDAPTDQAALQIAARSGLLVASISAYVEPRTPPPSPSWRPDLPPGLRYVEPRTPPPSPPPAAPEQTLRISRLGVAALVLGSVACLWAWVPIIGTFTLPLSIVGLGLGVAGLAVAMATKRHGLGIPVAGSVVCGLAVALVLITTVLPMSEAMVAQLGPGTREIKATAPPARVRRTVEPQWTTPIEPHPVHVAHAGTITVGDFELTLDGVWRLHPPDEVLRLLSLSEAGESIKSLAAERATRDVLTVDVAVRNISSTRRRDFSKWSWTETPSMRDEHGNAYTWKEINVSEHERTLNPSQGVRVRFEFEPPIDAANELTLTLPLRAVDAKGDVAFVIARTSISNTQPSYFGRALPAQRARSTVDGSVPSNQTPEDIAARRQEIRWAPNGEMGDVDWSVTSNRTPEDIAEDRRRLREDARLLRQQERSWARSALEGVIAIPAGVFNAPFRAAHLIASMLGIASPERLQAATDHYMIPVGEGGPAMLGSIIGGLVFAAFLFAPAFAYLSRSWRSIVHGAKKQP